MEIDLTQLTSGAQSHLTFECHLTPDQEQIQRSGLVHWGPIHATGDVYLIENDFFVTLDLSFDFEKPCDRCLEMANGHIDQRVNLKLVDESELEEILSEEEESSIDEDVTTYRNYFYRPEKDIWDYAFLALPNKHVCCEDCKGLCPTCGHNLNQGPCVCDDHLIDPRFAILKGLFDEEREV